MVSGAAGGLRGGRPAAGLAFRVRCAGLAPAFVVRFGFAAFFDGGFRAFALGEVGTGPVAVDMGCSGRSVHSSRPRLPRRLMLVNILVVGMAPRGCPGGFGRDGRAWRRS